MSLRVEESFEVRAPAELVWEWLADPRRVAPCLPGARLDAVDADGRCTGGMEVKVGPATIRYEGTAHVVERDAPARRLRATAALRDAAGGTVQLEVQCTVADLQGHAALRVTLEGVGGGRLAEFGRATAELVARQLLLRTADNLRAEVEPRASLAAMEAVENESLTLSGAFRERPMLRDTAVGLRARTSDPHPPRTATAVPERRETARVRGLWRSLLDRLRGR